MKSIFRRFNGGLAPILIFVLATHITVALVGMISIPFYLELMGQDGYGLVGFYFVLQGWMLLFDLGFGPAIGRQLSRYKAGAVPLEDAVSLVRVAEALFITGGIVTGTLYFLSTQWVATHWLGRSRLPHGDIDLSLRLVAWLLVFRWLAGVYQSALVGLERQIATNMVALVGAIARNLGSIIALMLLPRSPATFFAVWTAVTVAETAANRILLSIAMPHSSVLWRRGWGLLSREFSFATGLTLSSAIFTLITQADKLTLSHTLSLGAFGVFTLVVSICAGITLVVPPMVQSFQPRLTTLLAQGKRTEFVEVYRLSISIIIVISVGLAGTIAADPNLVLYAWTGNHFIARQLATTLTLFAIGSGISSFLYLPLILQVAHGMVRLHVIGYVIFGIFWIPAAIVGALAFGTIGAGIVWLSGNVLFLLLWIPVVHRRLLSASERHGLGQGAWIRIAILIPILLATRVLDAGNFDRVFSFLFLAAISITVMAIATVLSPELRTYLSAMLGLPRSRFRT